MPIKDFSPLKIVKKALHGLKDKDQKVICGRFGINEDRKTLSAIGKELKLSRERIRQIEREGLRKIAIEIVDENADYIKEIIEVFNQIGMITTTSKMAERFLDENHQTVNEYNALGLIFFLMPQIKKIEKTKELESSWMLSTIEKEDVVTVIEDWAKHLEKSKSPETIEVLVKNHPNHNKYEITFLSELPAVSKKLVKTETGHIGLAKWPEVNPRNVRDKIYYVLKTEGKPLHFDVIAKRINEQSFSKKRVVRATVHNELIADKRFVLIGRGIYALSEWGYKPGTVKDVIIEVMEGKTEPMTTDDIVKAVLKKRAVKKNTIVINLQTKREFKKVGKDSYILEK